MITWSARLLVNSLALPGEPWLNSVITRLNAVSGICFEGITLVLGNPFGAVGKEHLMNEVRILIASWLDIQSYGCFWMFTDNGLLHLYLEHFEPNPQFLAPRQSLHFSCHPSWCIFLRSSPCVAQVSSQCGAEFPVVKCSFPNFVKLAH